MKSSISLWMCLLLLLAGCERIPDWEREKRDSSDALVNRRNSELMKWLWTCRGDLEGNRKLNDMEILQDHFRDRNLTTLESTETKTFISSGFLWDQKGHLVVAWPRATNVRSIECRPQIGEWKSAKLVGHDSSLDLAVVSVGALLDYPRLNPWLERATDLVSDEALLWVAAPLAGSLQTWPARIQSLHPQLATSLDADLILLDQPLNAIQRGALLMDRQWRVVGIGIPSPSSVWQLALALPKLKELVESLSKEGDVRRPYTGFKLKFYPQEGFRVSQVDVGGPAYDAGLRADDLLLQWDGSSLEKQESWIEPTRADIGRKFQLRYKRSNREVESVLQMSSR